MSLYDDVRKLIVYRGWPKPGDEHSLTTVRIPPCH
jgi:hypothetical protein